MCALSDVRIFTSIISNRKWRLSRVDVHSNFLPTSAAERSVHVIPTRESQDKFQCLWLLLTASYGSGNANAQPQMQSDNLLFHLGMHRVLVVTQLFHCMKKEMLSILVAKIVNVMLIAGDTFAVNHFLHAFNLRFKFETLVHGPGKQEFFEFSDIQNEDFTCTVNRDDMLMALEPPPLTRLLRKEVTADLNDLEKSVFFSISSSLG